jgi:hypothetical protein
MTSAEIAALLAGLRMPQAAIIKGRPLRGINDDTVEEILTDCYTLKPVTAKHSDLCKRINTTERDTW